MPFRCRCGKTYEKADSFASHTSACAVFHQRRASDTNAILKQHQQALAKHRPSMDTTPGILPTSIRQEQTHEKQQQQQQQQQQQSSSSDFSETMMRGTFLPTGLSLQYALGDAARKRSMSRGDNTKFSP
ncbi:hypothetical protein BX666DRAFT_2026652 [Dichotomocladium elegans]|nr:hypothetical protein BX666DRAFT_2026652 [Dichotomocladium elegans]